MKRNVTVQCDQTIYFHLARKKHFRDMTNPHSIKEEIKSLYNVFKKNKS